MNTIFNGPWEEMTTPRVTILTPVYNRRQLLQRAIESVFKQTCKDFEYIIVNDGSTIDLDDIVLHCMQSAVFPMAYIKKENGGVHTARNAAIRLSRGEMILFLDSDDEYVPNALERFLQAWDSIPSQMKPDYREVGAFCQDENGFRIGIPYPDDINQRPYPEQQRIRISHQRGEQTALLRGDLMRKNLWPEPEGVKFVDEDLVWRKLDQSYKTWSINDALRIYHTDTEESYTRTVLNNSLQTQTLINRLFRTKYCFEHRSLLGLSHFEWLKNGLYFQMYSSLLRQRGQFPNYSWVQPDRFKLTSLLLIVPGVICSLLFRLHTLLK